LFKKLAISLSMLIHALVAGIRRSWRIPDRREAMNVKLFLFSKVSGPPRRAGYPSASLPGGP
jgi:hypothetical protein